MTKAQVFLSLCAGFLVGVGVGSVVPISLGVWEAALAGGVASVAILVTHQARRSAVAVMVCVLGFCLGGLRIGLVLAHDSELAAFVQTKQDFEGVVLADPDVRQTSQMLTVQPDGFSERVLVTATLASTFAYGDRVWIRGKVSTPEPFNGFDYPGYLARANIYTVMKYPKVITLRPGGGGGYARIVRRKALGNGYGARTVAWRERRFIAGHAHWPETRLARRCAK